MSATPAPDRLAVWTYEEAGEEIPHGDPAVTDAERSAAGRETITARWQALLPGNRSRAAARFAAGRLPEDQDVMRVWQPRDPAGLRARLTEPPLAVWAEDDVLQVLWQGQADEVWLGGGVQPRLWPVAGTGDLWEASLRIRRLDEAVITVPSRGMDRRPRPPVVGAAVPHRTGLAARTVMSVPGRGQSGRWLLSVRSSTRPDRPESGSRAPGPGKSGAAAVIHISTGPIVHRFTGADLRLCPNYPQIYTQTVILAGQKAMGEQ